MRRVKPLGAVRLWAVRVEIIDQDQVEIRGGRHLARAELAHAENDAAALPEPCRIAREILFDMARAGPRHGARQRRIGRARCLRRRSSVRSRRPIRKNSSCRKSRRASSTSSIAVCGVSTRQARIEIGIAERRGQQIAIDRRVEHMRTPDDDLRQPWRAAEQVGE